ncbi:uncharacterized protein LOC131075020 isoform X2 [Cryptomeria japonica]|nr:uncharacterized protein LOC131075020 isoform X2 [Cryptomeria japonica]XP_057867778.2 uncharacterized protein LOC131075020 isoform X2 [Cryptomeria japonica]XP_057867779.2 uncharacterized protein LOC131075020 isoform X2 [Cryptomeria japonica]
MVRSNDIRKNWPFSQKYLQVCLDNGRKPVLPPFEHPQSVRDLIQEKVKLEAAAIHGTDIERNDVITCEDIGAKDSGNRFLIRIPAKRTQTGQKNNRKIVREKQIQSVSVTSGDQDVMTRACREAGSQIRNGCDRIKTKTEEDEELRAQAGAEDGEMPKAIAGTSEEDNQGSKPIAGTGDRELGTPCKTEHKVKGSETETPETVEQASGYKLPNSEISSKPNSEISSKPNSEISFKARRKRTERPEILSDIKNRFLKRSKQSNKMLTFEMKSQELTDRFHKESKKQEHHHDQSKTDSARTENLVNSGGSVTDGIMMVKVCPVCRTFSSTSNTALNAHIDHCLDAEPNAEKTEIKLTKNKTKVRKKRSMVDICAVAPSRTLEDLIYTTTQQLDPLQLDVSKWNGTSIRRGHRTPLSRVAKKHFDYADPNPKRLRNSSILKTDCLPHLPKETQKEPSISGDRDKESCGTRKSRRSAFRNMTRAGKSLSSIGLDKCHDKVPRTSAVKHVLNEGISQRKSQHASEEITREEKLPSSVYSASWACFNKQGSSKRKKFKHKLVSLKLAGFGQRCYNPGNGVPRNVLEPKSQDHLEGSKLSEGNPTGSKESAGAFVLQSSDKGHYLPSDVSSKRNKARHSRKFLENNSNSSGELEEFFTSKRMKNLSSLNFQNTVTKVHSSVGETNSPNSVKPQVEQEVNCQYCPSNEERRHSSHDSAKISVSDTFNSQKSESIAVSKTLQHETRPSVRETQLSMSCQLKRARFKEHFKESKKTLNLKTLIRPNSFNPAAGSSSKKTGSEYTNVPQKRSRKFKCSFGSQKMKKVSHIVYGLMNMKDVAKIDSEHKVHDTESKRESQELIYDAGSTSNQAYSMKVRDSLSNKERTVCAMESSSIDRQHRSNLDLQSGAMSSGELLAKPLETTGNISYELAGETQVQLDSTVLPIYEVSKESSQDGAFVTDENLQNCMLSYTIPEKMGAVSCLLEACNNQPSYQQLGLPQAMCNDVTGNLSPNKGKDSSESCVSFQSQLNSCSVEELENLYLDDYLGKRDGFPRNLDGQFLCVRNEMKEKLSPVSLGNQTPNHELLTQSDSFYHKSADVASAILKPSCMSVRNTSSDSISYIETKPTDISSLVNISFDKLSSQMLKPLQESAISNETTVLISDSIDVTPVSNGSNFADKSQLSCELTSENLGITRPGLMSIDEVSPAIPQSFENFTRPAFDPSVQTSPSIITSTGFPLISQASLFQGSSILLQDSKSFATSNVLPAVSMPQFVSDSLLFAKSGDISTATDVLHGSILNPNSSTHPCAFNGILSSSNSTSSWVSEEQYGLKHNFRSSLSNPSFRVMDGKNGSYPDINACGFSPQVSNIPSHVSTLLSKETGAHSGSKLLPKTYESQLSESNAVSSLNSDMVTEQTDIPERLSSFGNASYSREPSIVHIFGNPILRLMGKNVILSSKDGTQSRQVEDVCTDSGDSLPNRNHLTSLESRSEADLGKDGHDQHFQALKRPQASDPDMLKCFEDRTGKDSNFIQPFGAKARDMVNFSQANTYRKENPIDMESISQVYSWNLTASPCQPLAVSNGAQHPWLSTKMPSSCVSPDSMSNGVSHGPADVCQHMKWQSPDSSLPHSDPEVIIIDDNIDTEATSIEASFAPTFLQGRTCQLQDGIMMSTHLKSNSKVRSRFTTSETLNNRNHFSNESMKTLTYGSGVLNTKEIPSELQRIEINFPGFQ